MNYVKRKKETNRQVNLGLSTIIGDRDYQQDYLYFYQEDEITLATICDGMGGMEGGEKASKLAATILTDSFEKRSNTARYNDVYLDAVYNMNEQVQGLCREDGTPLRAGTTVVSVVIDRGIMYFMSVGDSRIYILRNHKLTQINQEHNYYAELMEGVRQGKFTMDFVRNEEKTKRVDALTSFVGINRLELVDMGKGAIQLLNDDVIVLCSDGLFKSLDDEQIKAMILDNDIDMEIAADRLCEMSRILKKERKQDNTSVLLLQYREK